MGGGQLDVLALFDASGGTTCLVSFVSGSDT